MGRVVSYIPIQAVISQNTDVKQDPVISPGTVSQHVHKISGASNININSTYASLQEAECTSCEVQGI